MSALSIRLPHSLHERVRELAEREGISINQLIATALAEKMAVLMTFEYLDARAKRGSRGKFLDALAHVPDVEPDPRDSPVDGGSKRRVQPTRPRHRGVRRGGKGMRKPRPRG